MNNKVMMINGTDAGFFSIFRGTVGTFQHAEEIGAHPYVAWYNTIYNESNKDNAWEYCFEPVSNPIMDEHINIIRPQMHRILPRDYTTRLEMHRLIRQYVRVKPEINQKVNDLVHRMNGTGFTRNKILGIHYRGTDKHECTKFGEPDSGTPVTLDKYISHAKDYLIDNPDASVFLCTDDYKIIPSVQNHLGNRVFFYNDAIRSSGKVSVHHGDKNNGRQKAVDVVTDCLTLSKCDHIIKGISNVALCAMFWNADLTCENMNSIYNGDTREDFVNG